MRPGSRCEPSTVNSSAARTPVGIEGSATKDSSCTVSSKTCPDCVASPLPRILSGCVSPWSAGATLARTVVFHRSIVTCCGSVSSEPGRGGAMSAVSAPGSTAFTVAWCAMAPSVTITRRPGVSAAAPGPSSNRVTWSDLVAASNNGLRLRSWSSGSRRRAKAVCTGAPGSEIGGMVVTTVSPAVFSSLSMRKRLGRAAGEDEPVAWRHVVDLARQNQAGDRSLNHRCDRLGTRGHVGQAVDAGGIVVELGRAVGDRFLRDRTRVDAPVGPPERAGRASAQRQHHARLGPDQLRSGDDQQVQRQAGSGDRCRRVEPHPVAVDRRDQAHLPPARRPTRRSIDRRPGCALGSVAPPWFRQDAASVPARPRPAARPASATGDSAAVGDLAQQRDIAGQRPRSILTAYPVSPVPLAMTSTPSSPTTGGSSPSASGKVPAPAVL